MNANLTNRSIIYPSFLGLGHANGGSQWVELRDTAGPEPSDPNQCAGDPYSMSLPNLSESASIRSFGDYKAAISISVKHAAVEVNGTSLTPGEYWEYAVDTMINGTRYTGAIDVFDLGMWPTDQVVEYPCVPEPNKCDVPFNDSPEFAQYRAAHPEAQKL